MDKEQRVFWGRWAVLIPAMGAVLTSAALWYGNLGDEEPNVVKMTEIDQNTSERSIIINGDNNGIANTGDTTINGIDK